MKKYLILPLCATFCLTAGCAEDFPTVLNHDYYEENTTPAQPDVTEQTVRLGTYNLWISNKGTGDYLWTNRRDVLAQSIVNNDWDIFGFQEANATIQSELPKLVADKGGNYEWWFVGRDSQDGKSGEALGIAYDPDRFTLSDQHYYWLSETPVEMSYGWDELGYHRFACCAVVTDKRYGKQFLLTVTHLPLADMARSEAAKLIVEREQMYNKPGMPSVLVGDMNATPDDAASATFRTCWNDAYQAVDARFISGPVGTFNGHKTSTDLSVSTARIDYIYTRGSLALKSYRVDNSIYGGIYPSDHCPVSIQVDFNYDAPEPPQIEGAGTESDPWQINSTADWNAVGIQTTSTTAEWASIITNAYPNGDFQVGRLGWIADYPIYDNFMYPLFVTGGDNNYGKYSNADVDAGMLEARAMLDDAERIAKFQEVDKLVAADMPVIPLFVYKHQLVCSDRVDGLYMDAQKLADLSTCELVEE